MVGEVTRRMDILRFVYETLERKKYPPTVREICDGVGLASTSTVHGHLERLEKKGFLRREPSRPRVLEVTPLGLQKLGVQPNMLPVLGKVAAGEPILAVEEAVDYFPIPPKLRKEEQPLFMLVIQGDSMMNAGIFDGDKVIVRKQSMANNGEIVIAMNPDGEATCKRFFREEGRYRLQPENDSMASIVVDEVAILGKVVGLYRDRVR